MTASQRRRVTLCVHTSPERAGLELAGEERRSPEDTDERGSYEQQPRDDLVGAVAVQEGVGLREPGEVDELRARHDEEDHDSREDAEGDGSLQPELTPCKSDHYSPTSPAFGDTS